MTAITQLPGFRQVFLVIVIALPLIIAVGQGKKPSVSSQKDNGWSVFGRDVSGSHYNPDESILTPSTVANLKVKWIFEAQDDVSSQPIIVNGVVYFGSWDGREYAVDAKTGKKIWEYDCGQSTRGAAAYENGVLYFGDMSGHLHAVDAATGAPKWKKKIDSHPAALATSSPIVHQGRIYIGVSSREELSALSRRDYVCCTFRGSVVAFDAATGNEIWRWYTLPEAPREQGPDKRGNKQMGPAGVAVWSTVSLDPAAKRVYVTTGNQYSGPAMKNANSVVALDQTTGKEVWAWQAIPRDIWTVACKNQPDCDDLDVDFGTAPIFFKGANGRRLVGAGQKSGWFYALDPGDGKLIWKTEVGPGGKLGGIEYGTASDGERAYAAIS